MSRLTAAIALVLFVCPGVWAATPTDALQQVFAEVDRILTDPDTADRPLERLLAIRKLVNEAFDFRSAAELASGDHWRARTAAEQEEFTWLFADLLERSFVARMAAQANLAGGTRIKYLEESVEGETARVRTTMGRKDGGELLLDYRLIERDGAWKIRDVAIDGVSMMANYRAQLDRVLGAASFPELLTQMRAMVGTVEPPARTASSTDASSSAAPASVEATPPVEATPTVAASPSIVETSLPTEPEPSADVSPPVPTVAAAEVTPQAETAPTDEASLPAQPVPVAAPAAPEPRVAAVDPVRTSPRVEPPQAQAAPAVQTAPPAATAPPRTRTTKAYWLKISTVKVAAAGRLVSRLRDGKHHVTLERKSVSGKRMVHVSIGPFQDAAQAVFKLLDLQTKGHDPFLVAERE